MENSKGSNWQVSSTMDSNARKDTPLTNQRDFKIGGSTIVGSRNKGTRTLPYAKSMRRKEEGRCFHWNSLRG